MRHLQQIKYQRSLSGTALSAAGLDFRGKAQREIKRHQCGEDAKKETGLEPEIIGQSSVRGRRESCNTVARLRIDMLRAPASAGEIART